MAVDLEKLNEIARDNYAGAFHLSPIVNAITKAVIEGMMEPSDEMIEAGKHEVPNVAINAPRSVIRGILQAALFAELRRLGLSE